MPEIGYTLSSEEFAPRDLLDQAQRAEEAGFTHVVISDHYHPWTDRQGHSAFVWGVIGGLAQVTGEVTIGTGVTCPLVRIHPAIIAQAAATAGCMLPGRFFLGVGTGENLNEHILGDAWPSASVRRDMLEEAIALIHHLWEGGLQSFRGEHYLVDNARIYDLPDQAVPIHVAAAGDQAAELAGRVGDGLIATSPDGDLLRTFDRSGGRGKPRFGQLTVCWSETEEEARKTALEIWPNAAITGELGQELPLPRHFEQAASLLSEDQVAESMPIGPDPERYVEAIRGYERAGFTHVYVHQVGHEQEGFIRFFQREILPQVGQDRAMPKAG
jgi:coenzyme F420-dependent glucose-6-phosphate dehydrogenase